MAKCAVPSRQAVLSFSTTCPSALVSTRPLTKCRTGDVAAQLLQRLPVVGAAAHSGMQAEAVDVGAKVLLEVRIPGHGGLYRQQLLASTRTEGDAVSACRGLQRPERAGLVRITVVVGDVGRTLLFDQNPPTGEQLHRAGDDLAQHRLHCFVGWLGNFDELWRTVNAAPVHAVKDQAVKVASWPCWPATARMAFRCSTRRER